MNTPQVDANHLMKMLSEMPDVQCDCGSTRFITAHAVRKLSGLLLGAGAGEFYFASANLICATCGKPKYAPAPPLPFQVLPIIEKKIESQQAES